MKLPTTIPTILGYSSYERKTAEAILSKLGIPVSVFIDMTYRQVIMHDGIPFSLDIPMIRSK